MRPETDKRTICPATQLPCHNKQFMCKMLDSISTGQLGIEIKYRRPGVEPEVDTHVIDQEVNDLEERRTAIEKDLGANCNGSICGPLAQTATRFLFDGPSVDEIRNS